jgi:hypothetical protein
MHPALLRLLTATLAVVAFRTYRLRKLIWGSYPEVYASIGFKESDGAYGDAFKTILAIPFKMRIDELPADVKREIKLLRVFYAITVPFLAFMWVRLWIGAQ